ncbi:hypothetical protein NE237_028944 [Protea cynaroides]|uniref:peptidylprolyl isomerase n=1 Tax=Protea cynaroides TaxID=273540 RepID=A0A9Q0JUL6_9MAGN|nr:hypothetical protein NE237_028944 [Protea cynaroides]
MKTKMKMGFSMSWTVTTLLFSSLVLFSIYSNVFNLQRLGIIRDDLSSDMEVEVRITLKSSDNKEEEDEAINAYESWLLKHNLVDIQPDEKSKRFQFFKDNLRFINTENAKNHSYQLSLNKFADLNNMEFRSMYLGTAKPTLFRPLSHRYAHHEGDELPKSMDWRSRGAVTAVKDQGPYGSSWAYSTVASVEGLNSIVTGDLISLSEKHIQNCHKAGAGLVDYAFEFIIENGGVHINDQDFLINVVDNLETNLDYFLHMDEDQLYNHVQRCNLEDDRLVLQIDGYEYVYPPTEISLQKAVSYQPVIKGLDQGILGGDGVPPMLVGGKRKLQIPPELAYGLEPAGCFSGDCNIPANSTLVYDINFVGVYK